MKKNNLIPVILTLIALLFGTFTFVQSDETKETRENKTIEKKVEVKVLGDVAADRVTIDGDKIKVRLPNGDIQTIDLGNIKNGRERIEIEDGDVDVDIEVQGKAIVVGPDGEVKEYDLSDGEFDIELPELGDARSMIERFRKQFPGFDSKILPQGFLPDESVEVLPVSEFMIGVAMGPTSETLQTQLGLEVPGIAVLEVMPDSPASKVKMQKHDVLVAAGDQPLGEMSDLISAVDNAGSKETSLSIKLIRRGKTMEVEITPVKRPDMNKQTTELLPFSPERPSPFSGLSPAELDVFDELVDRMKELEPAGSENLLEAIEQLKQRIKMLEKNRPE